MKLTKVMSHKDKPVGVAILGTADIAFRRFLPALLQDTRFRYIGVATRGSQRAAQFVSEFGGIVYKGYERVLNDDAVQAVYIPLPPSLHYEWANKALAKGKHVFLEKPSTTKKEETQRLVEKAKERGLALKENYMFLHHPQLSVVQDLIGQGAIGKLRLIRIAFGFPLREGDDFRYKEEMGGGALWDCGGYALRLGSLLLGESAQIKSACLRTESPFTVDLFGSATLQNESGLVAQLAFGMDNSYKCELELWGSKGSLLAPRIFTAPPSFEPEIYVTDASGKKRIAVESCDQFLRSIDHFYSCIHDDAQREDAYVQLNKQAAFVNDIFNIAGGHHEA